MVEAHETDPEYAEGITVNIPSDQGKLLDRAGGCSEGDGQMSQRYN